MCCLCSLLTRARFRDACLCRPKVVKDKVADSKQQPKKAAQADGKAEASAPVDEVTDTLTVDPKFNGALARSLFVCRSLLNFPIFASRCWLQVASLARAALTCRSCRLPPARRSRYAAT